MLDRHLLRSIVLQSLFEWDIRKGEEKTEDIHDILLKNVEDFAQTTEVPSFAKKMITCIFEKKEDLDNIIQKAAPQWPIEKIPVIDRNILRVGICELLYADRNEVPPKVAINEAIELSKAFGGENSSKFISGVMGTIYKELGEPQKHETSDSHKKDIDIKNLSVHNLTGVMIYAEVKNKIKVVMVLNVFGYWTFLKGKEEQHLTSKEVTIKKVKRKIGLDIKLEDRIGGNEYIAFHTENGHLKKRSEYYLAKSNYQKVFLEFKEKKEKGIIGVDWFSLDTVESLDLYDDMKESVKKGLEILKKKEEKMNQ